jgi:hypothetical protein
MDTPTLLLDHSTIFLTPILYLLLSTLHIYCPILASASAILNTTATGAESTHMYNPLTDLELLFRLGHLHFYGNRILFLVLTISVSIFLLVWLAYIVLALSRGPVKQDTSQTWHFDDAGGEKDVEEWWIRNDTPRNSRMTWSGTMPLRGSERRKGIPSKIVKLDAPPRKRRRRVVSPPPTPGSEEALAAISTHQRTTIQSRRRLSPQQSFHRDRRLSSYIRLLDALTADDPRRAGLMTRSPSPRILSMVSEGSYRIPSYYFKEFDEDGLSIFGGGKPRVERVSVELGEVRGELPVKKPILTEWGLEKEFGDGGGGRGARDTVVGSQRASLTGTTVVSENEVRDIRSGNGSADGGSTHRVPKNEENSTAAGRGAPGDEGWETVYCPDWKGAAN